MKVAKRLTKIEVWFKGPHSAELFKARWVEPEYDLVFIGSGESKTIAADRALALFQGEALSAIYEDIEKAVRSETPPRAKAIEGDEHCSVYCIVGINYEVEQ